MTEPKSTPSLRVASHKPTDVQSYFWYLHGRIRTCIELIDAGRLNFACIDIDLNLVDGDSFNRLDELIFEELLCIYHGVYLHFHAVNGKKLAYFLFADCKKRIEEAEEVFKIKDPEEFYWRLKALEEGATGSELTMLRREAERRVAVFVDKPLGSRHPKLGWTYPINCGYVRWACTIYGDTLSAYILGVDTPIDIFSGRVIAVVYRQEDRAYKLIVAPDGMNFTDDEIIKAIAFDPEWCNCTILR